MAKIKKKTNRYPSDLTEEEWSAVEPFLPGASRTGSHRRTDLRGVLNALRYMVRSGCEWRMLRVHFPPWQTVYWWFRRFMRLFLFRTIHDVVAMIDRERAGRSAQPSAIVIDSQTVKAPASGGSRGFDGGKKIVGRKRHIAVDTDGRLLMVNLTTADISDPAGAQAILDGIRKSWPFTSSPMVSTTVASSGKRPLFSTSPSRSSGVPIRASSSCHAAGWSSEPLDGWSVTDASCATTRPGSTSPMP